MWWWIFSLLLTVTAITYYYYIVYNNWVTGKIKGPFIWPFVGNALHFRKPNDLIDVAQKFFTKYGPRVRLFIGSKLYVFLADPNDCKFILGNKELIDKPFDYDHFFPWFGNGIFTNNGDSWRRQRKLLTPAFHTKNFENLLPIIEKHSDILIENLKVKANGEVIDVLPYFSLLTVDVVTETAMGVSVNAQIGSGKEYVRATATICRIINERHTNIFKRWNRTFVFTKAYQEHQKSLKILHDFTNNIIKKRREVLQKEVKDLESYVCECGENKNLIFIDLLLSLKIDGEPISDRYVREEVDTFLFGGSDTTSSALSFILYLLSNAPDVQEKLYQKTLEIVPDRNKTPSYAEIHGMKYLEMVIRETMRLYPPVPLFTRIIKKPTYINDMLLPANSTVYMGAYNVHRNPEVYPDPDTFNPERQSSEEIKKRSLYSNLYFCSGPRNCIGQKLAMLIMKSVIYKLILNFKFEPTHKKVKFTSNIIIKPIDKITVRLVKRE